MNITQDGCKVSTLWRGTFGRCSLLSPNKKHFNRFTILISFLLFFLTLFRGVRKLFRRKNKSRKSQRNLQGAHTDVKFLRVDSMHTDVYVPPDARDGDVMLIHVNGRVQSLRVPKGEQGKEIRYYIAKEDERQKTGLMCCA